MLQNVDNWWQQQTQIYNNIEQTNDNDAEQQNDEPITPVDYDLNSIIVGLSSYIVYLLYERFI